MAHHDKSVGFSLVELSIVLVILGLLVGGILAGQSLIRAAELRSVSSDLSRYKTSLYTFRDKYFALPGDMTNATAFWGKDNTFCPTQAGTVTTPGTCNGDGDGKIVYGNNSETSRSWQQLALSGLIEGSYSGTGTPIYPGTVVPQGRIPNTGYALYWATATGSLTAVSSNPNRLVFGAKHTGSGTMGGAALKPEELWNIDTKIDDGLPSAGKLIGATASNAPSACFSSGTYSLSSTDIACYLTYVTD